MGERSRLISGEEIRRAAATVKMDPEKKAALRKKLVGEPKGKVVSFKRKGEKNG